MTQTYTSTGTSVVESRNGEHQAESSSSSCSATSSSCLTLRCAGEPPQHTHHLTYAEALSLVHPPPPPSTPVAAPARRSLGDTTPSNDAPTPLTSNCRLPPLQPPSLELTPPASTAAAAHPSSTSTSSSKAAVAMTLRAARFSSPTAPPIVMKRPIAPASSSSPAGTEEYRLGLYHAPPLQQERRPMQQWLRLLLSSSSSSAGSSDNVASILAATVFHSYFQGAIPSFRVEDALVVSSRPTELTRPTHRLLPSTPLKRSHMATPSPRAAARVRGIPNYGQTCFVNAVLQALASLEPLGEYLDCVLVRGQRGILPSLVFDGATLPVHDASMEPLWLCSELRQILQAINGGSSVRKTSSNDPHSASTESASSSSSSSSSSVSSLLLRSLHHLGGTATGAIDPRPILRRVSQQHAIFRPKAGQRIGREQQDAQEYLQALLGLVAEDSGISGTPAAVPCFFAGNNDNNNDHGYNGGGSGSGVDGSGTTSLGSDAATAASAARERTRVRKHLDLLGRTVGGPTPLDASQLTQWSTTSNDACAVRSVRSTVSASSSARLVNGSNGDRHRRLDLSYDEKKQDEFNLPTPAAAAAKPPPVSHEAFDEASVDSQSSASAKHHPEGHDWDATSLSDASNNGLQLTAAIRRMLATTSSITPSPLTGWMGSALQCRTCHHVRPIQNVPFLDIPIVPTNVSNYLHRRQGMDHHLYNPSKVRPTDVGPPCTLEQCLEDFTSVERVHDVECRCCTMRRAMAELNDEALLLRHGIEALSTKAHKARPHESTPNTDGTPDPAKHLRDELAHIQRKLDALRATSPDDEGALERILTMDDPLGAEQPPKVPLHRSDAFKCLLLTRLPAVLCIHVQRRFYDPFTDRTAKTAQHVIFPEYLDVGPFCAYGGGDSIGPEAAWAGTPSARTGRTQASMLYRLACVVVHAGGAFFGHYFCYRRDPYSDRWLWISDDTVRTVDWNAVRQSQAYMLFYEAL